jgi:ABC transporter DrrB family efflux protein
MTVALGIAFRNQGVPEIAVAVVENPQAAATAEALSASSGAQKFRAKTYSEAEAQLRLSTGKADVVVTATKTGDSPPHYEYRFDGTRPQSVLARNAVDDALQRAAGRRDVAQVESIAVDEPGGRYIDFLVPGLLGTNLLGAGLWGVGFVTVDMRIRKLLKRFLATPMKKWQFLVAIMCSRMFFTMLQAAIFLGFAYFAFGVVIRGSLMTVIVLIVLGTMMFFGLGLLIACRAKTQDAIFGLMNLVQLPMWILSGIFFSSDRFPDAIQPLIKALPLTPLIDSLRSVMMEGATFTSQLPRMAAMAGWGLVTFLLGLKFFRWQ